MRASWDRSARYCVPTEAVQAPFVSDWPTDSLLYECGARVLEGLSLTLSGEPLSMMLTDPEGLVLLRLCADPTIVAELERVQLAPGFVFSEHAVGTNGIGLALADRLPSLVRGGEHFCAELRSYTCAAAPILAADGELLGGVNLTTPSASASGSELLLALAQAAAGETAALMAARHPAPPGRSSTARADHRASASQDLPPAGPDPCVSRAWAASVEAVRAALLAGSPTAVVGEPGAGKTAALAYALRHVRPGMRLLRAPLAARPGAATEWLDRWCRTFSDPGVCLLAADLGSMPAWAADQLSEQLGRPERRAVVVFSSGSLDALPAGLVAQVGAVVEIPALRQRAEDILALARHFGRRWRREVQLSPEAAAALQAYSWPANVTELAGVVRSAAARADLIGLRHLPSEVLSSGPLHLTRLERLERDEIARCLTEPGVTMAEVARTLGVSRATLYRRLSHYGLAALPHG